MLTNEEIKQFQKIYLQHFGKQINQKDALNMGVKLLNLVISIKPNLQKYEKTTKNQ